MKFFYPLKVNRYSQAYDRIAPKLSIKARFLDHAPRNSDSCQFAKSTWPNGMGIFLRL